MAAPLERGIAGRLQRLAVDRSGLNWQMMVGPPDPEVSPAPQNVLAYVTYDHPVPDWSDDALLDRAASQLARELDAEVIRYVGAARGGASPPQGVRNVVTVPMTLGQPLRGDVPDVRGAELVGDPQSALALAIYLPQIDDVSTQADAQLDTGETFRAFAAGGSIIRLSVPAHIHIERPMLVGVITPPAPT